MFKEDNILFIPERYEDYKLDDIRKMLVPDFAMAAATRISNSIVDVIDSMGVTKVVGMIPVKGDKTAEDIIKGIEGYYRNNGLYEEDEETGVFVYTEHEFDGTQLGVFLQFDVVEDVETIQEEEEELELLDEEEDSIEVNPKDIISETVVVELVAGIGTDVINLVEDIKEEDDKGEGAEETPEVTDPETFTEEVEIEEVDDFLY